MQVSEIFNNLDGDNSKGIIVHGKPYKNLKDLIKNLLVKSKGTMSFYVKIPQSLLNGSNTDLNLVVNYTGFVKGNVTSTDDNL